MKIVMSPEEALGSHATLLFIELNVVAQGVKDGDGNYVFKFYPENHGKALRVLETFGFKDRVSD